MPLSSAKRLSPRWGEALVASPTGRSIYSFAPTGRSVEGFAPLGRSVGSFARTGRSVDSFAPTGRCVGGFAPLGRSFGSFAPTGRSVYSFAPTLVASPRWVKRPLGQTTRRRLLLLLLLLLSRAALTAGQVISTWKPTAPSGLPGRPPPQYYSTSPGFWPMSYNADTQTADGHTASNTPDLF